jgi:hypothetical protein
MSLFGDLRFRLVRLLLQPFDQVQRVQRFPLAQMANALLHFGGGERFLQQRGDIGDNDGLNWPWR